MRHRDAIADMILEILAAYVGDKEIEYFEVLGGLDDAQCRLTEKLIHEHPEIIPTFSALMAR